MNKLNNWLGRLYTKDDIEAFMSVLDKNGDGTVSLEEFKKGFTQLIVKASYITSKSNLKPTSLVIRAPKGSKENEQCNIL